MKLYQLVAATASISLLLSACTAPRVRPITRLGPLAIDGDIGVGVDGPGGSLNGTSSVSQLGLDDDDDTLRFQPRIDLDWDKLHLSLEGIVVNYSGTGVASAAISIPPVEIGGQTPVRTELDAGLFRSTLVYDVLIYDHFRLGLGGGLGIVDYDVDIRSLDTSRRVFSDDTLPFPYVSAFVAVPYSRFEFSTLFSAMDISYDSDDLTFFDIDAIASYEIYRPNENFVLRLAGGLRYLAIDYEYSDRGARTVLDLSFFGPHLGLMLDITF